MCAWVCVRVRVRVRVQEPTKVACVLGFTLMGHYDLSLLAYRKESR